MNPQEIFERYVRAGMTRDADAQSELFTPDGVFEAPLVPRLVPLGSTFPRRLDGRAEIREGLAAFHRRSGGVDQQVDVGRSRYVLHVSADPDVFVAEIDTVLGAGAAAVTDSLVQIYRLRGGQIAHLRDYFASEHVE